LREAPDLECITVSISYAEAGNRRIQFAAVGERYAAVIEKFKRRFK
jgi:hypothetical protein